MNTSKRYAPEVRQRAVRMVFDHEADYPSQWAAIGAIAPKIGCTPETLRSWVRQSERDAGRREGTTTSERERIKALAETVIGLFKTEVIRRSGPWRHLEAVEFATLEWVDWFNHRRLLEPIGNMPPAEREALYYEQQGQAKKVA